MKNKNSYGINRFNDLQINATRAMIRNKVSDSDIEEVYVELFRSNFERLDDAELISLKPITDRAEKEEILISDKHRYRNPDYLVFYRIEYRLWDNFYSGVIRIPFVSPMGTTTLNKERWVKYILEDGVLTIDPYKLMLKMARNKFVLETNNITVVCNNKRDTVTVVSTPSIFNKKKKYKFLHVLGMFELLLNPLQGEQNAVFSDDVIILSRTLVLMDGYNKYDAITESSVEVEKFRYSIFIKDKTSELTSMSDDELTRYRRDLNNIYSIIYLASVSDMNAVIEKWQKNMDPYDSILDIVEALYIPEKDIFLSVEQDTYSCMYEFTSGFTNATEMAKSGIKMENYNDLFNFATKTIEWMSTKPTVVGKTMSSIYTLTHGYRSSLNNMFRQYMNIKDPASADGLANRINRELNGKPLSALSAWKNLALEMVSYVGDTDIRSLLGFEFQDSGDGVNRSKRPKSPIFLAHWGPDNISAVVPIAIKKKERIPVCFSPFILMDENNIVCKYDTPKLIEEIFNANKVN